MNYASFENLIESSTKRQEWQANLDRSNHFIGLTRLDHLPKP